MIKPWMYKGKSGLPLAGWSYRKPVTLSRASGHVHNYQMKLLVGKSSSATGENVDCADHVAADFDDLRFTTSGGETLLDYWIESISGSGSSSLATVWIEFDMIDTGATTFYMYYGGTETAVSSGVNTFIAFDNFERGNDGDTVGGSWTEVYAHVHISTEQEYTGIAADTRSAKLVGATGVYPAMTYTLAPSVNLSIQVRFYKEAAAADVYPLYHGDGTKRAQIEVDTDGSVFWYSSTSTKNDTGVNSTNDAWNLLEINNFDWTGYTFDIWLNGTRIRQTAAMQTSVNANGVAQIVGNNANTRDLYIDNFIVRQYLATEPAWGAWGAQET